MATAQETHEYPGELNDVPGRFWPLDQVLFSWFLERQERLDTRGDLLELGAYLGKSAILLGHRLRDGETTHRLRPVRGRAPDAANRAEAAKSYSSLTRQAFERNYLSFHDTLPTIIQAPSSAVVDEVAPGTCRFVHIDASHLYEHVEGDIGAARELLGPDGIARPGRLPQRAHPGRRRRGLGGGAQPRAAPGLPEQPEAVRHLGRPGARAGGAAGGAARARRHRRDRGAGRGAPAGADPRQGQAAAAALAAVLAAPGDRSATVPASAPVPGRGPAGAAPVPERPAQAPPAARAARVSAPRERTRRLALDLLPPLVTRAVRRYRAAQRAKAGRASGGLVEAVVAATPSITRASDSSKCWS